MKRKKRSISICPFVFAGAAVAGYAALKNLLGLQRDADVDFFKWTGPTATGVDVGSVVIDLPAMYYRDDVFLGVFSAGYQAVQAVLPSQSLYPVKLQEERAAVYVAAFNYQESGFGPYGEVAVAIPCTYGRPAPPLLPLLLEGRVPGFGIFVLHLPVTARSAHDAGRVVWGYPKFVADMDFQKRPAYQCVRLAEGDSHILTLTVQQRGLPIKDNRPLITYSVLDGQLIKTTIPSRAVYQVGLMPGSGSLELGDHEIADQLRSLDISTSAVATRNYLTHGGILPAGESIGAADHPYEGYVGEDRDFGRFTVNYDDSGETIDIHAR